MLILVVHIVTTGLWRGCIYYTHRSSPYRAVNTFLLGYKNKLVNAVFGNNRCFFSEIQTRDINTLFGQNVEHLIWNFLVRKRLNGLTKSTNLDSLWCHHPLFPIDHAIPKPRVWLHTEMRRIIYVYFSLSFLWCPKICVMINFAYRWYKCSHT